MTKTIEIIVTRDGKTRIETKGFRGHECIEASRFIRRALGATDESTLKPEYHLAQRVADETRQRQ